MIKDVNIMLKQGMKVKFTHRTAVPEVTDITIYDGIEVLNGETAGYYGKLDGYIKFYSRSLFKIEIVEEPIQGGK